MSTKVSAAELQILPLSYSRGNKKTQHSFIHDGNEIKQSEHPILEFSEEDYVKYTIQHFDYGLLLLRKSGRPLFMQSSQRRSFRATTTIKTTFEWHYPVLNWIWWYNQILQDCSGVSRVIWAAASSNWSLHFRLALMARNLFVRIILF